MSVLQATADNFHALVSRTASIVLLVEAAEDAACRDFAPTFAAQAARDRRAVFGRIDARTDRDLAEALGVGALPALLVIRECHLVYRGSGALSAAALAGVLDQMLLIDMDDLRAEMAAAAGDIDAIDH